MIRFLGGDCREILKTLPDKSVQCVVTSPPYFGLRDYGTASWTGGDVACDHSRDVAGGPKQTPGSGQQNGHASAANRLTRTSCAKCGAVRVDSQIGLEATPALYVAEMVAVFREVRRVLRDDGTVWLNIGDSYNNFRVSKGPGQAVHGRDKLNGKPAPDSGPRGHAGFKEKDQMMIPARVAIALCDDGWYLRSQLPWVKRGCMPESVYDRPTNAVEYIYLLTKKPSYFYDSDAIKQVGAIEAGTRAAKGGNVRSDLKDVNGRPPEYWNYTGDRNFRNSDLFYESAAAPWGAMTGPDGDIIALDVNTMPMKEAHFATFPPKLIEPLIKAGTSEKGACPACGAPWARIVERQTVRDHGGTRDMNKTPFSDVRAGWREGGPTSSTLGWTPTCDCPPADPRPCVVLDPFSGAGTTALVADRLGRDAIGIDLNPTYGEMARDRLVKDAGMFAVFG